MGQVGAEAEGQPASRRSGEARRGSTTTYSSPATPGSPQALGLGTC